MNKSGVHNAELADMRHLFNWGLKISEFNELFIVSGHGNGGCAGDPVEQTKAIQHDQLQIIKEAGFAIEDIIHMKWVFVKSVTSEQSQQISALWAELLKDVHPKPAAAALCYVDRLAAPTMKVEFELLLAR